VGPPAPGPLDHGADGKQAFGESPAILTAWKAAHRSAGGHQGGYEMREIVNAILYRSRTGCQWEYLPHDLPPRSAAYYYFARWRDGSTDQAIHDLLRWHAREPTPGQYWRGRHRRPERWPVFTTGATGPPSRDAECGTTGQHQLWEVIMSTTEVPSAAKGVQVRLNRVTPSYCRVVLDNPPLNLMGPEFVLQMREVVTALENDDRVKVVVFASATDGFFLNHSDFLANIEDLTSIPQGPTGLEAWPDVLVRLTRAPFVSIALIRGRATGNGSELALACDLSFASREKAVLSQWEVGVGLVAGGGPMARLPRVMGRGRALEVLLSSDDIRGPDAERLGYVNRALPDAELDSFVDALATRIASFDKWAIANTKRLVNEASLPPDVEMRAGWDACMASVKRPAAQERIKTLLERGLQQPGDVQNRLGFHLGQLGLKGER